MRNIITALLLFIFSGCYANDTLTRSEIYNFGVGDTFDYKEGLYSLGYNTPESLSFKRIIITNVSWSGDSLTKYITRQTIYPSLAGPATLTLSNPKGYEVFLDTVLWSPYWIIGINSSPSFFGQATNDLNGGYGVPLPWRGDNKLYGRELGVVLDILWSDLDADSTILIYYSGINGRFGVPYTVLSSVGNLNPLSEKINVFPSPNNGKFTVQIPEGAELPLNFSVYDITGKMVKQFVLNEKVNQLEMPGLSRGMYLWKVTRAGKFLEAGKMVVE